MADEFCHKMSDFHVTFKDLIHAVNLRHGTNGFTSLLKEGVLRIFSPCKIRRLRPGLKPRTWVPKASTLSLDHRRRYQETLLRSAIICTFEQIVLGWSNLGRWDAKGTLDRPESWKMWIFEWKKKHWNAEGHLPVKSQNKRSEIYYGFVTSQP